MISQTPEKANLSTGTLTKIGIKVNRIIDKEMVIT